MLTSLEINNFRTFANLKIERFGRVNLIVGKNNVGKTTLLEALRLYGSTLPARTLRWILERRDEVGSSWDMIQSGQQKPLLALDTLRCRHKVREDPNTRFNVNSREGYDCKLWTEHGSQKNRRPTVEIHIGSKAWTLFPDGGSKVIVDDDKPAPAETWLWNNQQYHPTFMAEELSNDFEAIVAAWWDASWLLEGRKHILPFLRVINDDIKEVTFAADPRHPDRRMPKVLIDDRLLPLASAGSGVVRLLQIGLALENEMSRFQRTKKSYPDLENVHPLVLIDEVETGIHHTLHAKLWEFIFQTARRLGVQVFATTHSWDCLDGFAQAIAEDDAADAMAIRLERDEDEEATRAIVIDDEDIPIVVRDSIEVR